jgi:hypothetical protein
MKHYSETSRRPPIDDVRFGMRRYLAAETTSGRFSERNNPLTARDLSEVSFKESDFELSVKDASSTQRHHLWQAETTFGPVCESENLFVTCLKQKMFM